MKSTFVVPCVVALTETQVHHSLQCHSQFSMWRRKLSHRLSSDQSLRCICHCAQHSRDGFGQYK
ncbi:hypothetical protein F2Q70_00044767 [Brassica cretica]|uniref:Secreted protein n=2 Tax=Brassica TaxID=3705 RepID=A0ABQ7Z499_BRANA|nr:hypothetical protein F2Q70_00044767 [Brassica cretica]KAH0874971.1 hypothetical protein HID58_072333 [Brassica napus]